MISSIPFRLSHFKNETERISQFQFDLARYHPQYLAFNIKFSLTQSVSLNFDLILRLLWIRFSYHRYLSVVFNQISCECRSNSTTKTKLFFFKKWIRLSFLRKPKKWNGILGKLIRINSDCIASVQLALRNGSEYQRTLELKLSRSNCG